MFTWFEARGRTGRTATNLYGSIVAQARSPVFYTALGVPDSMDGRYGLLVLHLWLVVDRLAHLGDEAERLSRVVIEAFVTDMDDNMREIGVGDLAVPRKVKKAAAGLYDRGREYEQALASGDEDALADLLSRHLGGLQPTDASRALARYVRDVRHRLGAVTWDDFAKGHVDFPAPKLGDAR
jgi:cytochrome b pre-mRNA-processing protein 3